MVNWPLPPAPEPLTEPVSAEPEEDMERIPETFKLDEDDLREAITEWLNEHHQSDYNYDYTIEFKVTEKRSPGRGMAGGMNDDIITTVVSAVATRDE
jgi:hypothetical protein